MLLPKDPPVLISDEPKKIKLKNKYRISTCSGREINYTQCLFVFFSKSLPLSFSQFTHKSSMFLVWFFWGKIQPNANRGNPNGTRMARKAYALAACPSLRFESLKESFRKIGYQPPRSRSLRNISIQKRASRIGQVSTAQKLKFWRNTNL